MVKVVSSHAAASSPARRHEERRRKLSNGGGLVEVPAWLARMIARSHPTNVPAPPYARFGEIPVLVLLAGLALALLPRWKRRLA